MHPLAMLVSYKWNILVHSGSHLCLLAHVSLHRSCVLSGYEEGGTLTESVRRRPYQILLLDEFEKGHRDVWNILLQLFDEGQLTDSHGRKVDFKNVIVVMTSNIGANVIAELPSHLTGSEPAVQESIMEVVRGTLSPELLKYVALHEDAVECG